MPQLHVPQSQQLERGGLGQPWRQRRAGVPEQRRAYGTISGAGINWGFPFCGNCWVIYVAIDYVEQGLGVVVKTS
jgi:hypothetical protein